MQEYYVSQCRILIEQHLGWGSSALWTTQDFEELSIQIHDKTHCVISSTTLKRIWGRVTYNSTPSRHSLDALARFLEYKSWRAFTQGLDIPSSPQSSVKPVQDINHDGHTIRSKSTLVFGFFMLTIGAGIVLWLGLRNPPDARALLQDTENVMFRSRPVATGLPNTVVFDYDLGKIKADSFFIQQSWDPKRRVRISPDNKHHSAIYYYPGYFDAKLVANNTILKELPVHVKTQGWTAIARKDSFPVYLPGEALLQEGALAVSPSWLAQNGLRIQEGFYELGFYNVRDFGPLDTDNFSMKVSVKHTKKLQAPCQGGQAVIRGRYGIIRFPINIPGCAGKMNVTAGDVFQSGKDHDMSALGADYNDWQSVRLGVQDRSVRIQIGTNSPYTLRYTDTLGQLVGIWFQFAGPGSIDTIQLKNKQGQMIYEEMF